MKKINIREVSVLPMLMHWRKKVIENVFGVPPSGELMAANRRYYQQHISDRSHIAIVAEANGVDAGCGAICLTEELPSPDNPSGRCAYLMNVYVEQEYRGQGIGHSLVRWLVEKAKEAGCDKIYLETTVNARSLYINIGFKELPGIMKYADIQDSES